MFERISHGLFVQKNPQSGSGHSSHTSSGDPSDDSSGSHSDHSGMDGMRRLETSKPLIFISSDMDDMTHGHTDTETETTHDSTTVQLLNITSTIFRENFSSRHAIVRNMHHSSVNVDNCTFEGNTIT